MHNKISRMEEKCHPEKLKQQIIKCLNCSPNSNLPPSLPPSRAFESLFCEGTYLVGSPRGWALCCP